MHPTAFLSLAFLAEACSSRVALVAYIDPGAGSLLLQYLIGGLLGGFFVLKQLVAWTRSRMGVGSLGLMRTSAAHSVALDDERRRNDDLTSGL